MSLRNQKFVFRTEKYQAKIFNDRLNPPMPLKGECVPVP